MAQKLGKYELIKRIGEGASSTVFLGRDPFAQRDVAIKVATPEVLKDPEKGKLYSHLFLNEASLVGKLNHPHITQIYDAVVAEKVCYIVMEYVAGGTLEAYVQPGHSPRVTTSAAPPPSRCGQRLPGPVNAFKR